MERMRNELAAMGENVHFVTVNKGDAATSRQKLINRCAFPIFQDGEEEAVWSLFGGGKDDMFVYASDGSLFSYLPVGGELDTNLSTEEGYNNLLQTILEAP